MDRRFVIFLPEPFPDSALRVLDPARFELRIGRSGPAYGEDELARALADADALAIYSRDRIDASLLDRAPRLKVIAKGGSKPTSNVDIAAAEQRGIRVLWTPGANAVSVAELTLAVMLAIMRRLPELNAHLRGGGWRSFDLLGRELAGLTLGLVGFGAVGREVARRYAAFGGPMLACDPALPAGSVDASGARAVTLDALLGQADIVSLHCELNARTAGLIDARRLAAMKRGAILVNTARGGLVDEASLRDALDAGHLAGAALDVFCQEPPPAAHPLVGHPRVFATPHIAAFTTESLHRESAWALEDAGRVLAGLPPLHLPG